MNSNNNKEESTTTTPVITTAYAVVSQDDYHNDGSTIPSSSTISAAAPAAAAYGYHHTVNTDLYGHIPEARNLTWEDEFFDNGNDTDDIVAVFDLDYDLMENYYASLGWCCYGATCLFQGVFWTLTLLGVPCFLQDNVRWSVRSQHVAVTRDGVRFVQEKRQCCYGAPCTDKGKVSKTIPFDKISDCIVSEPAGNTCLCIPNTLFEVHVDTASNRREGQRYELTLAGLKDPHNFKKLVWAMKRNYHHHPTAAAATNAMLDRGLAAVALASNSSGTNNNNNDDGVADLLREIRDELRQNNQALQTLQQQQQQAQPTATTTPSAPPSEDDTKCAKMP